MISPSTIKLGSLSRVERTALTTRSPVPDPAVAATARAIVEEVANGGDAALRELGGRYGGWPADGRIALSPEAVAAGASRVPDAVVDALEAAADAVRAVHEPQRPEDSTIEPTPGVVVDRRWSPLRRVGIYVPGGRAAYPSSLIMAAVPAAIAAVGSMAVTTPADATGNVDPLVLAAAVVTGVDDVYAIGGAQAVAALAYGTETVRPVDKIVGPGGPWVTAAKLAVYGRCAIDLPAGPSEALIVADETADPVITAADLLCQAEHGSESPIVLVVTDPSIGDAIVVEADRQVAGLPREHIVRTALDSVGLVVLADDLDDALAFADDWAPEHLTLHVASPAEAARRVPSAGSVFVGHWSPESAGDYATGANHVLPTGGLARSHGPLGVEDFGSWRQVQTLTEEGLKALAPTIRTLAEAEGLTAHARCVDVRFQETG